MAKAKSKRQLVRDERRKKKRDHELVDDDDRATKRQRRGEGNDDAGGDGDLFFEDDGGDPLAASGGGGSRSGGAGAAPEMEFFGMLTEEEQEYFRRADELLELNAFGGDSEGRHGGSADEERRLFLASVFREARGKELKLASSQSCSRLMERLIQVASRRQLRHLFAAFAEHYATLVTHRFASHCCEQLFLQAAKWVGRDDEADVDADDDDGEDATDDAAAAAAAASTTMADLYLLVLDELEPHLTALLTDRFASHTLRVLLVVLSGRPQDAPATRSLLRSKNKETVRVGAHGPPTTTPGDALTPQQQAAAAARASPPGFTHAVRKIIADVAAVLDGPALRVLATHPTGNPVLQLLVELELADAKSRRDVKKKAKDDEAGDAAATAAAAAAAGPSLLDRLLPGAPASLLDAASPAADLLRSLVYDRIGSRLLETLIVHSPAKLFKALHAGLFAAPETDGDNTNAGATSASATPMAVFLRNDIACYPAMRVLERLGRDDLTRVVQRQILAGPDPSAAAEQPPAPSGVRRAAVPLVTQLVQRRRFHVLRTLLERCAARAVDTAVVQALVRALEAAAGARRDQGGDPARLITVLCWSPAEGAGDEGAGTDPTAAAAAPSEAPLDDTVPPVRRPAATAPALAPTANGKAAAPSDPPADIHGCHLLAAMLALPGAPATAVETALRALDGDQLARLATASPAGARVLVAALATAHEATAETAATSTTSGNGDKKTSHPARRLYGSGPPTVPLTKQLVARLVPHVLALAASPAGHTVLVAIVQTPSRAAAGPGAGAAGTASLSLPFHLKDAIIVQLAAHEETLRESWPGRAVWRAWRGDLWRTRRSDWVHFAKAGEPEGLRVALAPVAHAPAHAARPRLNRGAGGGAWKTGANAVTTGGAAAAGKVEMAAEEEANGIDAAATPAAEAAAEEAPKAALTEEEERARQEKYAAANERRKREKLEKKAKKAAKPRMTLRAIKEKRARKKLEKREKKEKKETPKVKKEKREDKYAREKLKRTSTAAAA